MVRYRGGARFIETDNTGAVQGPEPAMGSSGNAIAVWKHSNGSIFDVIVSNFE
jgi:hypothetical protein